MTKRYDMENVSKGYDPVYKMTEQPGGDWVRWEDYAALQSQWDDMQQGLLEVFGEPVRDAVELLGATEKLRWERDALMAHHSRCQTSAHEPKPNAMCKHDDGDCHPEDPCNDCPKLQPRSECPRCGVMILTGPTDQHFCRGQRTKLNAETT